MEILLNELSLTGQFKNGDDFLNNLDPILKIIKLIEKLEFSLAKEYMFFDLKITATEKLSDFLRLRTDRARKVKSFLANLANNPPFWNDTQKHNCSDNSYVYRSNSVCHSSLAESCERDRMLLSFSHMDFMEEHLEVYKNTSPLSLYNIRDKNSFLDHLLSTSKIEPFDYSKFKFEKTNLNFSLLEEKYGFDSLETAQQLNEFLNTFNEFSQMSWEDIQNSDGLKYKPYKANKKYDWFRKTDFSNESIYKFRVSQEYRCFGYRKEDEFFVLRFEIGHKISDNG